LGFHELVHVRKSIDYRQLEMLEGSGTQDISLLWRLRPGQTRWCWHRLATVAAPVGLGLLSLTEAQLRIGIWAATRWRSGCED
jgi:hypothetical protein